MLLKFLNEHSQADKNNTVIVYNGEKPYLLLGNQNCQNHTHFSFSEELQLSRPIGPLSQGVKLCMGHCCDATVAEEKASQLRRRHATINRNCSKPLEAQFELTKA